MPVVCVFSNIHYKMKSITWGINPMTPWEHQSDAPGDGRVAGVLARAGVAIGQMLGKLVLSFLQRG